MRYLTTLKQTFSAPKFYSLLFFQHIQTFRENEIGVFIRPREEEEKNVEYAPDDVEMTESIMQSSTGGSVELLKESLGKKV